ncbi:hypothetical protein OHR68_32720 [Spirillospora sp. NBC_00431]
MEFEAVVSPGRHVMLPQYQSLKFSPKLVGRTITVRLSHRTVHVLLDGQLIRTRTMSFTDADLQTLLLRGGRPAGAESQGGISADSPLAPTAIVAVDRKVTKDGVVSLGRTPVALGRDLIGKHVTLRMGGSTMCVNHAGLLVRTLSAPIPHELRVKLTRARTSTTRLPPPLSQPRQAIRRIGVGGTFSIARQRLRPGDRPRRQDRHRDHRGDLGFRVLDGDVEIATHPPQRRPCHPLHHRLPQKHHPRSLGSGACCRAESAGSATT